MNHILRQATNIKKIFKQLNLKRKLKMAYFTQDMKKKVAPLIKTIAKKYGVKTSIRVSRGVRIIITVIEGSVDFNDTYEYFNNDDGRGGFNGRLNASDEGYGSVAALLVNDLYDLVYGELDHYDNSNPYEGNNILETAFYMSVKIGDFGKPYILKNN